MITCTEHTWLVLAGAVGNNGIGIAGAAWNVKLMHIKVFQSTGQGNATTIADGVEYAYSNGATIINMSFGSYAESSTLKLALRECYIHPSCGCRWK